MKRMSLVLVLAVLIMTYGLFAQQEKVTFAQTAAASQGNIMIADNMEVQTTTTTTKEKRKHHHRKQHHRKQHHEKRKTTTTTERPRSEENRTNTTTTTEIR